MKTTTIEDIKAEFADREMGKLDLREFLQKNGPFQEIDHGDWRQRQYIQSLRGIGKIEVRTLKKMGLVLPDPVTTETARELSKLADQLEKAEVKVKEAKEVTAKIRAEIAKVRAR